MSCVLFFFFFPFFFLFLFFSGRSQTRVATCCAVMLTSSTAFRLLGNHRDLTSCPGLVELFQNLTAFHALGLTSWEREQRGWRRGGCLTAVPRASCLLGQIETLFRSVGWCPNPWVTAERWQGVGKRYVRKVSAQSGLERAARALQCCWEDTWGAHPVEEVGNRGLNSRTVLVDRISAKSRRG